MIRFLNENDENLIQQAKHLWQEAFSDSDAFTEYYFSKRSKPEYILCLIEDGVVLSMLHVLPQKMNFGGRIFDTHLIAGVATRKCQRRKGYAEAVLLYAHRHIDTDAFILQPANEELVSFYEKYGYKTLCKYGVRTLRNDGSCKGMLHSGATPTAEKLLAIYSENMRDFENCVHMEKADFEKLLSEADESEIKVLCTDSAFVITDGNEALLCGHITPDTERLILSESETDSVRVICPMDVSCSERITFNMIRSKLKVTGSVFSHLRY